MVQIIKLVLFDFFTIITSFINYNENQSKLAAKLYTVTCYSGLD